MDIAASTELKTHSDEINKFLVTVHNSAHLKRPDPSTLPFWVKVTLVKVTLGV